MSADDDPRTRDELLAEIASLRQQLAARHRPSAGDSEELRLILDAIPALVAYIDASESYCLVNRAYEEWFELPRGAILGKTLCEVLGEAAYLTIRPHVRAALAGDRVAYAADIDYLHGTRRHIEASYTPHVGADGSIRGFVALVLDVSDSHRDRENLRFLAQASRTLGASLDLGTTLQAVTRLAVPQLGTWCSIYLLGPDTNTIDLVAVSHVDPERAATIREIHRLYPPAGGERGLAQILRDGKTRLVTHVDAASIRAVSRDDAHHALLTSLGATAWIIAPLAIHGRLFGAISLGLTDPHRRYEPADVATIEELARRASAALDNARLFAVADAERTRAEDANRAKDLFLSTLSHELRTPLTAILGWTRLLRTPTLPDDRKTRGLETIERNARAQVAIIEDILDISRIVTGKLRLELRTIELVPLVLATLDTVRPTADARGLHLHTALDPSVATVRGDPDRLQQVIWNLLTNAVKFTPRGGTVDITLTTTDGAAELRVLDTGQGIDPAFLPRVFDRFSQSDATTTRAHGGLGLGLAIVRHIVELHGGTVDAHSDGPGRGASFRVRIPLASPDPPPPATTTAASRPLTLTAPPDLTGLRVLIVDDDPDTRELIVGALEQCHARVTAVTSAPEALAALAQTPRPSGPDQAPFDVLISDIAMPGEDGYSLIRKLRALPSETGGRIPTIALTAYARGEDRTRALLAGFDRHVAKPIEPAELLVTLANLCGKLPFA